MKFFFRLLFSPFLLVTGALVVFLYYLSFMVGVEVSISILSIFVALSLLYIIVALVFRYFFGLFVNSISLKLIGFYITTAVVPLVLLAILTVFGIFFAIGISQSYFLTKSINYHYNESFSETKNNRIVSFDTDHKQLFFKFKSEKKLLDSAFFEKLHNYLDFDFAVYTVDLPFEAPGSKGLALNGEINFEEKLSKVPKIFNKLYSTDNDIVLNEKNINNFDLNLKKISYPVIYLLGDSKYSDWVVFYLQIDTSRLINSFFYSNASFSKFNRLVLKFIFSIALALFAFQVYLFLRGVFYMSTISSSAGLLKKGANEIAKGNFDYKIRKLNDKQLNEIGISFNSMAKSIKKLISQLVEKQQMEHEFQIARKIQASALSVGFHKEKSIDMAVFSEPSKEVGGDYFNFIKREDGITILAGDVSGKGLGAAMYVSEINGLFSAMVTKNSSGLEIAEALHRFFIKRGDKKVFFTATLLEVDFKLGIIHYFRMGDPPLIVRTKQGDWNILKPIGIPAGMRGVTDFAKYIHPQTINIQEIDAIFVFSDGYFEIMGSSENEIIESLEKSYSHDAKEFYDKLVKIPNNTQLDKNMLDDVTFAIITLG